MDFDTYMRMYTCKENFKSLEENVLLPNGFIKLLDENAEYIAFNPEFNILFYFYDIYCYDYTRFCFFQPHQNDIVENRNFKNCFKVKEKFPLFTKDKYLNITTILNGFENYGYEPSLRRIAQFPILMDAIGEANRQQVYNIINSGIGDNPLENNQQKVKTFKK